MSATALALVLVAAVAHALWNLAARTSTGDGGHFVFLYVAASAVLWVPVTGVWLLLHPQQVSWAWLLAPLVSGLLHTAYGLVLQRGYLRGDLSLVYPVARGVGPLVTLVVAVLALGERPPPLAVLGALVVIAGIAAISMPGRDVAHRARSKAGLGWGAATGLSIAAYTLWDSHAVTTLEVPPLAYFSTSLLFQLLPLAPRAARRPGDLAAVWRAHRRAILTVAVLSPLAYLLVLEAMLLAPVALVASTRESSIVVGALLGSLVLGEPGGPRRTIGALVVLGGIALVALG